VLIGLAAALLAVPTASAELVQGGPVRVAVSGSLAPKRLPRHGAAPIEVTVGGHISTTSPDSPPQLEAVAFAFNRAGKLNLGAVPKCRLGRIDPSTTQEARSACASSLVGEGHFSANVRFPEQSPFPSQGRVLAFNGALKGKPVVFAHIYGTQPVPTSYVLPLVVGHRKGTFSTTLSASLPEATGKWGYVTGLDLRLGKGAGSGSHSFLSAGCPAPAGFPGALFPLVRTSFSFVGGRTLTTTLTRSCKAKG
jgi:hypothetical protein